MYALIFFQTGFSNYLMSDFTTGVAFLRASGPNINYVITKQPFSISVEFQKFEEKMAINSSIFFFKS
jgi:hypothetical protein